MGSSSTRNLKEEVRSARRSERKYKDLQPIPKDIYPSLESYLRNVNSSLGGIDRSILNRIDDTSIIARDLMAARLRKIAVLAVMNNFGSSESIDLLTSEERVFYDRVYAVAKQFSNDFDVECGVGPRTAVTKPVEKVTEPVVETPPVTAPVSAPEPPAEIVPEETVPFTDDPDLFEEDEPEPPAEEFPVVVETAVPEEPEPAEEPAPVTEAEPAEEPEPEAPVEKVHNMILVRITGDIPPDFPLQSTDGNVYSVKKGQVTNLPSDIAGMLLSTNMAEKLDES